MKEQREVNEEVGKKIKVVSVKYLLFWTLESDYVVVIPALALSFTKYVT